MEELSLNGLIERLKSSQHTGELIYLLNKGIQNDGKLPSHKANQAIYLLEKIAYSPVKITKPEVVANKNEASDSDTDSEDQCTCYGWRMQMYGCSSSKCQYYKDFVERLKEEEKLKEEKMTEEEKKINKNDDN